MSRFNFFPLKLSAILLFFSLQSEAQFKSAMVGVNGLTCSACCRTVEMSIRKLPFVKDVEMNLDNTEGKIIFEENVPVEIENIAKAVTDAGFSVRYLEASYLFNRVSVSSGYCFNPSGTETNYSFQFVKVDSKTLNGEAQLKFIGAEFLPKDELKKFKSLLIKSCTENGGKVYFVTL